MLTTEPSIIYVLYDTITGQYYTGQFPQWDDFSKSKIWHRVRDAKLMLSRNEKAFENHYNNARYRAEKHPYIREILDEVEDAFARNAHKNQGLTILEFTINAPVKREIV